MAKKKSLFKKLRKSGSSLVAEPEAPVDDLILEALAKPKVEQVVAPAIIRKPYIAPEKTYPAVTNVEVNKNDIFGALDMAKQAVIEDAGKREYVGEFYSMILMKSELLHIFLKQNFLAMTAGDGR